MVQSVETRLQEQTQTKVAATGQWPRRLYRRVTGFRLWLLLLSKSIEVLGFAFAGFFVAMILLSNGLSLSWLYVFYLFYAICAAMIVGTVYSGLLRKTRQKGYRIGMIIGTIASAFYMGGVAWYAASPDQLWLLCLLAVAMAAQDAFLWPSEHIYTAFAINKDRQGGSLAALEIARRAVAIVAPLAGGYIVTWLGQTWLTVIAAAVILLRLWPICKMKDVDLDIATKEKVRPDFKAVPWRDRLVQLGFSGHAVTAPIIWPIYIAVSLGSFTLMGLVASGGTLGSIVVLAIVGWTVDRRKKRLRRTLLAGTAFVSAMHVARLSVLLVPGNPWVIGGVLALYDALLQCQYLPYADQFYKQARQYGVNYMLAREVLGFVAPLPMFVVLAVVTSIFGANAAFAAVFVLAAALAWLVLLIRPRQVQTKEGLGQLAPVFV